MDKRFAAEIYVEFGGPGTHPILERIAWHEN